MGGWRNGGMHGPAERQDSGFRRPCGRRRGCPLSARPGSSDGWRRAVRIGTAYELALALLPSLCDLRQRRLHGRFASSPGTCAPLPVALVACAERVAGTRSRCRVDAAAAKARRPAGPTQEGHRGGGPEVAQEAAETARPGTGSAVGELARCTSGDCASRVNQAWADLVEHRGVLCARGRHEFDVRAYADWWHNVVACDSMSRRVQRANPASVQHGIRWRDHYTLL